MSKTRLSKNSQGYGYKYTDLAQIHEHLESNNMKYYQYIERVDNDDYIMTVPIIDEKELPARRGVRIVDAVLQGTKNPAQEQGSAITYARRYSLLMAFGLATEDDDGASLTKPNAEAKDKKVTDKEVNLLKKLLFAGTTEATNKNINNILSPYKKEKLEDLMMTEYVKIIHKIEELKKKKKEEVGEVL